MDEGPHERMPRDGRVDRGLLGIYLNDHLAGSTAGSRRMGRTARTLQRTPVGPDLARLAQEVTDEREALRGILRRLELSESRTKQAMTWLAETLGRLKLNGRFVRPSPMTPLLEVELLRSAVVGKLGLWQTLLEVAPSLGLDRAELDRLLDQTQSQVRTLDRVHEYVRPRALRLRADGLGASSAGSDA